VFVGSAPCRGLDRFDGVLEKVLVAGCSFDICRVAVASCCSVSGAEQFGGAQRVISCGDKRGCGVKDGPCPVTILAPRSIAWAHQTRRLICACSTRPSRRSTSARAARWIARLIAERPVGSSEIELAAAAFRERPTTREARRCFAAY
jgi:hypothetical protein